MGTYVSLHGKAFGFDSDTGAIIRNGAEGGSNGQGDNTVTAATTASNISPRGTTTLATTAVKAYTLDAPQPGLFKTLMTIGNSTSVRTVTLASGTLETTAGSTKTVISFGVEGQAFMLQGLSTALWGVVGNVGAVTSS